MPAQNRERQTEHPISNWTLHYRRAYISPNIPQTTTTDPLLRQESQAQTGQAQLQTRHPRSDLTSQLIPDSLGPDIIAQTWHPSSEPTASDSTVPHGTFKPRPNSHEDQTSRFRPDVPPQTEQPQTRQASSDQTFKLTLRSHSLRPDIPAQTG